MQQIEIALVLIYRNFFKITKEDFSQVKLIRVWLFILGMNTLLILK